MLGAAVAAAAAAAVVHSVATGRCRMAPDLYSILPILQDTDPAAPSIPRRSMVVA